MYGGYLDNKVITICGPTASGKSDLAINVARRLDAEIISADSMQIYQGMDIGTAKVSKAMQTSIKHHMIDIVPPDQSYSVAEYSKTATYKIKEIFKKGKNVVLCGGTGQYINALLDGLVFIDVPVASDIRNRLVKEITTENATTWHEKIIVLDPVSAQKIDIHDLKRIRRFFEVLKTTGLTQSEVNRLSRKKGPDYKFINFYLKPERGWLYQRIDQRVREMFASGLIDEVAGLLEKYPGIEKCQSFQAIGYKETVSLIEKKESLDEAIRKISKVTRNYAKRQYTWFNARDDLVVLEKNLDSIEKSQEVASLIIDLVFTK